MDTTIDARGLSCPQPVLMTLETIKSQGAGTVAVLVDTETARENVARAAQSQGWSVERITSEVEGYRVLIRK